MFSFQQTGDPAFGENDQQDLLADLYDLVSLDGNINHQPSMASRTNRANSSSTKADDLTNKKLIHRQNEKQRRKQMANLYASLTNLLPLEFIKGKRAASDQLDQTVKYIKHMQENIKVLGVKRDQLKNLMSMNSDTNESLKKFLPNTVVVDSCNEGFEILINSCSIQDGFLLSRVLNTLVEEGLIIISCTSTIVSERLVHTIRTEANNQASIDPSLLQQRLAGIANNKYVLN